MNEYKLTSKHIQLYADHLRLEEKGAATIEKYLRDVRAFGFWLDGREISKENTAAWKAIWWNRATLPPALTPCSRH